jgi:hypothetical protein
MLDEWQDYEESRRRKHPGARWWRLGFDLRLVGCLPFVVGLACVVFLVAMCVLGITRWSLLQLPLAVLGAGVVFLWIGAWIKGRAYRMARKDGIGFERHGPTARGTPEADLLVGREGCRPEDDPRQAQDADPAGGG